MSRLHSFLRADRSVQSLVVQVALLVIAVRLALWLLPFRWVRRSLMEFPVRLHAALTPVDTRQVARIVQAVSRPVPGATCLTQALVTRVVLARAGLRADLRIGVARNATTGAFEAHAWIEYNGEVIIGGVQAACYVPLPNPRGALL